MEKQQSMNHLYFVKVQAWHKRYLKNKIILKTNKQKSLIECFKILYHFWHQHAAVTVGRVGSSSGRLWRSSGRSQHGGHPALPKFMCICRLWLEFCWYSLMIFLWAFKWSFFAIGWMVVPKKKFHILIPEIFWRWSKANLWWSG